MKRIALIVALLFLMGCSNLTHRENCIVLSAAAGAFAGTTGALVGAVIADCDASCQEHKLHDGEPFHEVVQHHYSHTTDAMTYGGIGGFVIGGALGAGAGYLWCPK